MFCVVYRTGRGKAGTGLYPSMCSMYRARTARNTNRRSPRPWSLRKAVSADGGALDWAYSLMKP